MNCVLQKRCSDKFGKIHKKKPVLDFALINNFVQNFIEKIL